MRSNGLSRLLAETRRRYTPTLNASTVHAFTRSPGQYAARQRLLMGAYDVPASVGKPEAAAPTQCGREIPVNDSTLRPVTEEFRMPWEDFQVSSEKDAPATLTHFQSPLSAPSRGQRACPRPRVLCCALRGSERSGALHRGGAPDAPGPPAALLLGDERSVPCPTSLASDSWCRAFLAALSGSPTERRELGTVMSRFPPLAGLGFQPLREPRYLQHPQAFCSPQPGRRLGVVGVGATGRVCISWKPL